MADVLSIELRLQGLAQLDAAEQKAGALEPRIEQLQALFEGLAQVVSRAGAGMGSALSVSVPSPTTSAMVEPPAPPPFHLEQPPAPPPFYLSPPAPPRAAPGPYERLEAARAHHAALPPDASEVARKDAELRLSQAQTVVHRHERPPAPPPFRPTAPAPSPAALQRMSGPFARQQEAQAAYQRVQGNPGASEEEKRDAALRLAQASDAAERALRRLGEGVGDSQKRRTREERAPEGPASRLAAAREHFEKAQQGGTPEQKFDAQVRLAQAQAAKERAARTVEPQERALVKGPAATLTEARQDFARAKASGSPEAKFDAGLRLARAEKGYASAQKSLEPKSFASALGNVIKSSRYGVGPSGHFEMMPLVGRSLEAVMGLGPLGIAAGVATAALTGLYAATEQAGQNITSFMGSQFTAGGTTAETAQLRGLGGAVGLDPGAMGGLARQFREQRATNPAAMAAFGADPGGDAYGRVDVAQGLIEAIEHLRSLHERGQDNAAIRQARVGGIEQVLPLVLRTSDTDFARIMEDAKKSEALYGQAAEEGAQRLNIASSRLSQAWQDLVTRMGLLDFDAAIKNAMATVMSPMQDPNKSLGPHTQKIMKDAQAAEKRGDRIQVAADAWAAWFASLHEPRAAKTAANGADSKPLAIQTIPHPELLSPDQKRHYDQFLKEQQDEASTDPTKKSTDRLRDAIDNNTQAILKANAPGTNLSKPVSSYVPNAWPDYGRGDDLNSNLKGQARSIGFGPFGA